MMKKNLDENFQIKIGLSLSGKKREIKIERLKLCKKIKKSSSSLTALSIYSSGNKAENITEKILNLKLQNYATKKKDV